MNRKEAAELLPIIKAYAEGKEIEIFDKTMKMQKTAMLPHFDCDSIIYRIKPEPKYRPFKDAKECWQEMQKHQPFGWIKCKEGYFSVVYVNDEYAGLADKDDSAILLASENSYKDNTFKDGTPFGMKVEEQLWYVFVIFVITRISVSTIEKWLFVLI